VPVFIFAGSMSTSEIVAAQADTWYFLPLFPSFIIYVIAMVGETNRAPFDLPEAEGELVGGFHTEYSSLKFALFFLAEYVNMVTVSALATTLFLGGWRAPFGLAQINDGVLNTGYWPVLWFFLKTLAFIFFFVWLRGTLPRMRYDQFMDFGWKVLIPVSLLWIMAVGVIHKLDMEDKINREFMLWAAGIMLAVLALSLLWPTTSSTPSPAATPFRPCRARRQAPRRTSMSEDKKGIFEEAREVLWDPIAGFGVTFRTMFRKPVTEQYPFEKIPTRASMAGTSSTAGRTDSRSASAVSCVRGPARPTRSTSRVPRTSRADVTAPANATAASTRSTTCAASCADSASRPARHVHSP